MAAVPEIIDIACEIQPELATIVPEKRQELTTEGGLNVLDNIDRLRAAISKLHSSDILVSLFVEPDINQIDAAAEIEADIIEIHTGNYANAVNEQDIVDELEKIHIASKHAKKLGLGVNAGHGLNYSNVKDIIDIVEIDELSIGHAIIARSVFVGLEKAISEMKKLLK